MTDSTKNKPNFLCVGAAKAGTTTLYHLLHHHPEIFLTTPKELNFFSVDERFHKGWDWYLSHFREVGPQHKAIGEFGVTYTVVRWKDTIPRMKSLLPELKIIYMVRDPVRRIESQWIENRLGRNRRRISFSESVRRSELIEGNRYWCRYQDYANAYGAGQIHVIFFEQFIAETASELRRTFEFLGVDPAFQVPNLGEQYNRSADKREDTPVLDWTRRIPGFNAIRNALPEGWRRRLSEWLKRRDPVEKPTWLRSDYEYVCQQLRDDNRRLLRHFGMPEDFWTFRPTHPLAEENNR